jgi:DNA-binding NarL/FixJ family response regulator
MRILIVDDQEIMRIGLSMTLSKDPSFEVVGEAEDVADAVEQTLALAPDVVLMDIGLRTGNGIDAVRQIKEVAPNVRAIMFTSHESDDEIFAALSAGAEGYCLKNVSGSSLASALNSVANGAMWLDPGIASKVLRLHCRTHEPSKPAPVKSAVQVTETKFALSSRELEVLGMLVEGLTNPQIADRIQVSPETVKSHVRHIMEKLLVADRTQAAVKALREGLV